MNKLFTEFKYLFKELGPSEDLVNMYLVFMGVRTACLISNVNTFYLIPKEAKLEIYFGRYPGTSRTKHDYPLVCLKNSLVSRVIQNHSEEFTEHELGLYLGFNCFDQEWKNTRINRHGIRYSLWGIKNPIAFYNEVCSLQPEIGTIARVKFKAREMTAALKLMNPAYIVKYQIEFIQGLQTKKRNTV